MIATMSSLAGSQFFMLAVNAGEKIGTREIVGTWIAAFLTLCIFSFLWNDNPLYKFAEHLFVGVSAGYTVATTWNNVMIPNLWGNVSNGVQVLMKTGQFDWRSLSFVFAGLMGIMLLMRLTPSLNWLARWPLAFMVGLAAGLIGICYTMDALVIKQLEATIVSLLVKGADGAILWSATIQNWLLVIGVCTGLIYFYFSKEHKGLFYGTASKIGIYVLMMAFGAAFGYTVMARVSLLIGRMLFFRDEWWPVVQATFGLGG